jgi:sugar phosphate isomerase/epimerase
MSRPVTLFTGQWADLPLEKLALLAQKMGYDGLELACDEVEAVWPAQRRASYS